MLRMLAEAREFGFLGPGSIDRHVEHARGFARAVLDGGPGNAVPEEGSGESVTHRPTSLHRVLDLGSGGGLPGLVLALEWPDSRIVLLDAGARRVEFLQRAVSTCELEDRVRVLHRRAEDAGRDPQERGSYDLVVARSFGLPAVTAECAAPFLRAGGLLVASEPPPPEKLGAGVPGGLGNDEAAAGRWPVSGLALLGMSASWLVRGQFGYRVAPQRSACPERFPRRVGVPAKRPLF